MPRIHEVIAGAFDTLFERSGRVTNKDVIGYLVEHYPDVLQEEFGTAEASQLSGPVTSLITAYVEWGLEQDPTFPWWLLPTEEVISRREAQFDVLSDLASQAEPLMRLDPTMTLGEALTLLDGGSAR